MWFLNTPVNMSFDHPCSVLVCGPSGCGKSVFISRLLQNVDTLWSDKPEKILFCYSEMQPLYNEIAKDPRVTFHEGLPDLDMLRSNTSKLLVVFDDLMDENADKLISLMIKGIHHWGISGKNFRCQFNIRYALNSLLFQ